MDKKVFVFDIDGTLLNDAELVQESHIKALSEIKNKGHKMVLCSGRGRKDIQIVLDQMPKDFFRYLICNNGTYIHDLKEEKYILYNSVPKSLINKFEEIGRKNKLLYAIHTPTIVGRGVLWKKEDEPNWYTKVYENEWHKFEYQSFEKTLEQIKDKPITQMSFRATKKIINEVIKECKIFENINLFLSGEVYIDITPEGINKFIGIKNMSKILDIPISNFIAFGDSGNDIEMLEGAGMGISFSSATIKAQEAANIIIGSNNSSALADKVLELI